MSPMYEYTPDKTYYCAICGEMRQDIYAPCLICGHKRITEEPPPPSAYKRVIEKTSDGELFSSSDPVDSKKIMAGFGIGFLILALPFLLFLMIGIAFFVILMLGFASDSGKLPF